MKKARLRIFALISAAACCFIIGALYMWSVFNAPLMAEHGWDAQQVSLAYSLYSFMMGISTLAGGWLQRTIPARILLLVGGLGFSLAWFVTSFATTLPMLYAGYSVLGGFCDGVVYNVSLSVAAKWYPDKKGMANAVCVGCAQLSPLFFAPVGNALIETFDTSTCFMICGVSFAVAFLAATAFASTPPAGWAPDGWKETESRAASHDMDAKGMLKTPLFYVLLVVFVAAASSGLMMIGHASTVGQRLAGLSSADAAITVGVLAVASFVGSLLFGTLSDKLGRFPMLIVALAISCAVMLIFMGAANTFWSYSAALFLVGLAFGGVMTVMPSICGDIYGLSNFGFNYAVLFFGYTIASFVGPSLAAGAITATGSYDFAFHAAGALAAIGLVLSVLAFYLARRMRRSA